MLKNFKTKKPYTGCKVPTVVVEQEPELKLLLTKIISAPVALYYHLLSHFMMKEVRNPEEYITSGMMAM